MMDRRALLIGLGCVLAAPAIVRASSLMPIKSDIPILWGDGIHDDWEAMQAALDGKPFRKASSFHGVAEPGRIADGTFRTSRTISLSSFGSFSNSTIICDFHDAGAGDDYVFSADVHVRQFALEFIHLESGPGPF